MHPDKIHLRLLLQVSLRVCKLVEVVIVFLIGLLIVISDIMDNILLQLSLSGIFWTVLGQQSFIDRLIFLAFTRFSLREIREVKESNKCASNLNIRFFEQPSSAGAQPATHQPPSFLEIETQIAKPVLLRQVFNVVAMLVYGYVATRANNHQIVLI